VRRAVLVSRDVAWAAALAADWRAGGDDVTIVLLDAAAGAVRPGADGAASLSATVDAGVSVAVEEGALRRRGLVGKPLLDGVKVVALDEVADLVADGAERVVWL
jgi:intracellular sulfur oxidation DsrE/DsrF family protein